MEILKDKRGLSLGDLYPAVLAIIIIGIALGIGIFILDETARTTSSADFTVTSENISVSTAGVLVASASTACFNTFAVTTIANQTGVLIPANNYTVNADTGSVGNVSSFYGKNAWTINYTYKADTTGGSVCSAINTSSTGLSGFATWIAVIVVVIAAAVVLGVVISSFGGTRAI